MPVTQRDAMKVIRTTAEAVMESLRMLLIILMNQIEVKAPDSVISEHHASSLLNLLDHVNAQKEKIEELSTMLQETRSPKKTRAYPGAQPPNRGDQSDQSWELEEEEEMIAAGIASPPRVNLPRSTPAAAAKSGQRNANEQSHSQENQLALTAQAIESWGNKRVSWGKTHSGKRFATVYEEFPPYVEWIKARAATANPAMQDFITYAQAREDMEHQALKGRR